MGFLLVSFHSILANIFARQALIKLQPYILKGLLQRRFSRVAVRGAAKVRLRALQAITGRIQGRLEVEEGKFYSAEDADRATSTNYLYQEPDCRVERLPDALASTLPGGG